MSRIATKILLLALAIGAAGPSLAQTWPAKPIRMVVPFPPGGGVDFAARVIGRPLAERLGQPIVIENRAGANGIIAMEAIKQAGADSYTLGTTSNGPLVINPS